MQTHFPELIITNKFHMGKGCQQKKSSHLKYYYLCICKVFFFICNVI